MRTKELAEKIVRYLKSTKGPVSSGELWLKFESAWTLEHDTAPSIRRAVTYAIKEMGVPIGSNNHGFYFIRTAQEAQAYMNSLSKRQARIADRINDVYNAFHGTKDRTKDEGKK